MCMRVKRGHTVEVAFATPCSPPECKKPLSAKPDPSYFSTGMTIRHVPLRHAGEKQGQDMTALGLIARLTLITLLGVSGLDGAIAQTRPLITAPRSVSPETFMYVGNSFFYYNNGMPGYVSGLADGAQDADKRPLRGTMVTIGGSGFDWHDLESYFRPRSVGYYTFDKDNVIVFNKRNKFYDAVLMMDCSQCPIHPQLSPIFVEYAKKNAEIARNRDSEPMLFMSWAYSDKPEMTAQLDRPPLRGPAVMLVR